MDKYMNYINSSCDKTTQYKSNLSWDELCHRCLPICRAIMEVEDVFWHKTKFFVNGATWIKTNPLAMQNVMQQLSINQIWVGMGYVLGAFDMTQGCSKCSKPKTCPLMAQKETFQNRGSTNTSHHKKCYHRKNKNHFSEKNTSHHRKYFTSKYMTAKQLSRNIHDIYIRELVVDSPQLSSIAS